MVHSSAKLYTFLTCWFKKTKNDLFFIVKDCGLVLNTHLHISNALCWQVRSDSPVSLMPQPSVSRTTAKGHLVRKRDTVSKWEKEEEGWEDKR